MLKDLLEKRVREIVEYLGVSPSIEVGEGEENFQVIIVGDDLSFLIGFRGESLNALQTLLAQMLFAETGEWSSVIVDINGYRDARKDRIEEMVKNFIDRVRFHGAEVVMPPMNSFERRQVHLFVESYPDVVSESTGEGRDRKVVLKLT